MSRRWVTQSYAKINLGLHVLERLPNGYHILETGFCFIEWSDRIEMRPAAQMELHMSEPTIPVDDSNLIVKALQLLQEHAGLRDQYHISVDKRVPAGAGLGGGSANAAAVLRMVNKVANLGLAVAELAEVGLRIGADVPFFIHNHVGIGRGLGHEIEMCDIQPDAWIVTVFPNEGSSTVEAYERVYPNPEPDFNLKKVLTEEEIEEWPFLLINDLEPGVIARIPQVGNMKDQMLDFGAEFAGMSGSGSSVFGLFHQDFVATEAYESFIRLGYAAN
ncbi:4-(cytidine 5'-diphospho)-2-C-methyl-D-erythritol kinase, partial [Balneolaceae bacterium]|nr:4-(cytidine 5'-diphospho)-2-C-methyl-D-erythritol kinase [Balneolaceae bacterium]